MNILVTGSAGMIGGYVVKGLIEKGHTVLGIDRVLPKAELRAKNEELREDVVLDLSDREAIDKLFADKKIDRGIHLAAKVIAEEKAEGRAKHVIRLPRWMVVCGY